MHIAPGKKRSWDSDLYKSHLEKNFTVSLGGAVGIGGGGVVEGRMVGFGSCEPADALVMVALCNRADHYIFAL